MDYQSDLLAEFDREAGRTRKIFEAIPDGADLNYKPHAKSMSLGQLAGHITDMTGTWALSTLTKDKLEFAADHKWEPYFPAGKQALIDKFEGDLPTVRAALEATTPEKWDQNWQFIFGGKVWIDQPRIEVYRDMVMNHLIHHRAQLGVFLRLLDAKLPAQYGPSADGM